MSVPAGPRTTLIWPAKWKALSIKLPSHVWRLTYSRDTCFISWQPRHTSCCIIASSFHTNLQRGVQPKLQPYNRTTQLHYRKKRRKDTIRTVFVFINCQMVPAGYAQSRIHRTTLYVIVPSCTVLQSALPLRVILSFLRQFPPLLLWAGNSGSYLWFVTEGIIVTMMTEVHNSTIPDINGSHA